MALESKAPAKPSPSAWRDARGLLWGHRGRLLIGLVLLILSRIASFALPASSKFLVDEVITRRSPVLLAPLAGVIMAVTLVQALASLALTRVLGMAAQRLIMQLRGELQGKVMSLPISFFDSTRGGVLISRIMTDPDALRSLLGTGLIQLAGNLLTALLALVVLLWLNWRLTAMTLALLGVFGALIVYAFNIIRPLFRQRAEIGSQVVGRLSEALAGIRVVKAYRAEENERQVFAAGLARLFASVAREVTASSAVGALATAILGAICAILVFFGGREVLTGSMTLGDFVMFVFFIGLLLAPVMKIAEAATQLGEATAGLDRIRELRQMDTEEQGDVDRLALPSIRGEIEFRDVDFEYVAGTPVLKGISFCAAPGSTTAFVGPSGAGKSTAVGLVMGFYRPTGGRILVDGQDLSTVRTRDFRAHLGVVLQENFLFDGTIAENIAYAKPGASRQEIIVAAQTAHCDQFVEQLEGGYETLVGERGVKLSGGQRQRVAIARAILANPRLLILDEATSSLDSESEALVQDGLRSLRRGRTTFVIAHRLSTIHSADQILVLDGGAIVERGTHQSLMAQNGRYRSLHERQFRDDGGSPAVESARGVETSEPSLAPAIPSDEASVPVLDTLLRRTRRPGPA